MHIVIAVVLLIALGATWDVYGPKTVLKVIAWTVGSSATALVIIATVMSINAR